MTHQSPDRLCLLNALPCQENEETGNEIEGEEEIANTGIYPLLFLKEDDNGDDDLHSLYSKEEESHPKLPILCLLKDPCLSSARRESAEWILRVVAHFSFSSFTALLSINYLDRFLASVHFQRHKPWVVELTAVACLSLAAKVQEIHVPLLLDLQVEEMRNVFEAKTIQRMELLVLSTLEWKMNPVTPLSFVELAVRRIGLKPHQRWDFFKRCERLILSVVADPRIVYSLPSIFAAATMLHVIYQMELCNSLQHENQLLGVLNLTKEKVEDCFHLIPECWLSGGRKRKLASPPGSPKGVIGLCFSCESSNDSWASSSSYPQPLFKRRLQDQ